MEIVIERPITLDSGDKKFSNISEIGVIDKIIIRAGGDQVLIPLNDLNPDLGLGTCIRCRTGQCRRTGRWYAAGGQQQVTVMALGDGIDLNLSQRSG